MTYHVMIWPRDGREQANGELYGFNLTEDQLRQRVIEPYEAGTPITLRGRTVTAVDSINIGITDGELADPGGTGTNYDAFKTTKDVTDDWITGAFGGAAQVEPQAQPEEAAQSLDPKRVMVVHGRNESARVAMFHFLRALGLQPIEWEAAIRETGMGSPHNLEAVRAAMDVGQAVVVVLTAEDQAGLLPVLTEPGDPDTALQGQPRQNVILEAGLAMGIGRDRTILVEIGPIRRASDFDGLNAVRMSNAAPKRMALKSRLEGAGCDTSETGTDWLTPEGGGDFESCVVPWQATDAPAPEPSESEPSQAEVREAEAARGRQERARPAPENVSRAEHIQARDKELNNKLYAFLDRRRGVDQPFSELDLVEHMGDKKFDEVAASRLLRRLHKGDVIYPNPDGSGWYPTDNLGGMERQP
jgi:predicted nucleotide-binding protein